ncbi:MAG: hypothetical protein ACOCZ6_02585 [Nanoarchaeota archaeon]
MSYHASKKRLTDIITSAKSYYNKNKPFNKFVNTFSIYVGIKGGGYILSYFSGENAFNHLSDVAAPAVSGIYAMNSADGIEKTSGRVALKLGISFAAGLDIGRIVDNYEGTMPLMQGLDYFLNITKQGTEPILQFVNLKIDSHEVAGLALGGITYGINSLVEYKNKISGH